MKRFNVVIIGAGPAGSFLAYKLGEKGVSVLLLEKEKFPRYKICAGGLSKKSYDILFSENNEIEKIIKTKISKGLYVRNKKLTFTDAEKDIIYMIYRSELDDFLVNMATDKRSVDFEDNVTINNLNIEEKTIFYKRGNKEKIVEYDILVGAWGINKKLNMLVNLIPFDRFSISSSWEGFAGPNYEKYSNEYAVCQIFKKYPGVVGYIFPKKDKITAGLFTSLDKNINLKKVWKEFISFWGLDKKIKPSFALIPIRDYKKPIAQNNILLIGDAAGLADPFTGEGIYYALKSSIIASNEIKNFLDDKSYDLSNQYNKKITINFSHIQKWAKRYEFLFHHFTKLSFWFGSEFLIGNYILNSFITGEIKYNELTKIIKYSIKRIIY
jgi:geranylgeranyl reductase family protein